jgi:thiamine biosynthesis lipoprotein
MGTLVTISVVHPDAVVARAMVAETFAVMERLEGLLSRHREGTPVSRLNREGVVRAPPPELVEVVQRALEYSSLSKGAFDITIEPLLNVYTRSFSRKGTPPTDSQVQEALSRVDYRQVLLDDDRIALGKSGMSITLDGIAKGYIIDQAVGVLRERGADQVLVDAGGDMASVGDGLWGDGWQVAIQNPRDPARHIGVLRLQGECVATSGDYLQSFTQDRRFHHILDPRTGTPADEVSSVTIVTPTALSADALSTAIFVLGPEHGLALLSELDGVEGVVVTKGQDVITSSGLDRYIA